LVKVLLVPSIRGSMGSGHLRRSLRLARLFGPESALLLEDMGQALAPSPAALLEPLGVDCPPCRILEHYDPEERWDLVILDRRSSDLAAVSRFFPAPVVGMDEGGEARRFLSYLIDTLPVAPGHGRRHEANLSSLSLLELPVPGNGPAFSRGGTELPVPGNGPHLPDRRSLRFPPARVLISFGGEDPADLSWKLLELLLGEGFFQPAQVTVVQGPYFKRRSWPEGVAVLRSPGELRSLIPEYDLVFCSFGLTTYEALAAGVPVINLNPSSYHRSLSGAAGMPEIGVGRPGRRRLRRVLAPGALQELLSRYPQERFRGPHISELPGMLRPPGASNCPVCARAGNPAVARFSGRSYFRCRECGIIYLLDFGGSRAVPYDESYFFSEYSRQYGKTYLEDFPFIKSLAFPRLRHIRGLAPSANPRLLDVGCAYGPFLQAARERGFRAQGLDVSREAAGYVRDRLGITCGLGDFSSPEGVREIEGAGEGFDVITLWYVIEHFQEVAAVLWRINGLLRPGGVLAFSTPSASGISARKSRTAFLEHSPPDHYTVWTPAVAGDVLRRFGFALRKTIITGHHGERFPWPWALTSGSPAAGGFSALSRIFGLGDTFEAYAVKVKEPAWLEKSAGLRRRS
jgi:2-polyprenyl-3-methyl-5-hydroxy-6-metoxy-1,4-benzoquinol methylase